MAGTNIDNLNFKVILDDEKFNQKINDDIELAKQLNVQLSALLNVKSRVSNTKMVGDATKAAKFQKATADAAAAQERLKTASTNTAAAQERLAAATANAANAQERLKQSQMRTEQLAKRITAQTERQNKAYAQQSRILNELKGLALGYLSIHGAGQLLTSLVRVTGEFEEQRVVLGAMLGDLNVAEGIITRIQGLAVESPFQFKELTTYAKQLSAFSVPAQELYDTTKMLADVSAGLGVGMDRIILAYGQVRSAAFLRGQEVRQFTEAGIPILDELAKQFSELEGRVVSTGEVFDKISKRLVPFEMVAKIFKDMTSEGGKFFNMQEVRADTLKGKWSNLKDAFEVMLNEIGSAQSDNLKEAVDWARRLMQNYEQTGRTLVELIATYGIYKSTLLAIEVVTNSFTLANHKLIASLVNAGKFLLTNPYVAFTAALTGVGYALYKQHTALEGYQKLQKEVASTQSNYNKEVSKETAKLDALYAKLKLAKKGTKEYQEARKEIFTQYAGYISELRAEGVEVSDLAGIYDNLKTKIEEATKARTSSKAKQKLTETYDQEIDDYYDRYIKIITRAQKELNRRAKNGYAEFTEFEKAGFWKYISGSMNIGDLERTTGLERVVNLLNNATTDASADLKILRSEMTATTREYNKSLAEIKRAYGELDDGVRQGDPKGKSPAQKAIEEQIKSVQKLQDAYEKLMPYLNEVQMKSTLKSLFPNIEAGVIDSLDFNAELERLADKLEKFDKDAAQRLRDTIGKDVAGTIVESFRAVEQYKKMMDSWLGEDFNLSGEGVAFDISKIISNLNSEYAKIDQKRAKALDMLNKAQMGDEVALAKVREVLGEDVWQKYLENGEKVINELAIKERNAAKQTAEESIRDTANKYVKERMSELNIDLSDFGDKSIGQIMTYIDRLKDEVTRVKLEMATLYFGGLTDEEKLRLEGLIAALEIFQIKIDDTEEELDKKIGDKVLDVIQGMGESLKSIGDEMQNLGEEIDSSVLSNLGKSLSEYGEFAKNISSSIKDFAEEVKDVDWENTSFKDLSEGAKGGLIGLIASVATFAYNKISEIITHSYEQQRLLNEASAEYAEILNEIHRESYSGIFGTDEMALAAENAKILAEATDKYNDVLEKFNETKLKGVKEGVTSISFRKTSVADIMGDISEAQGWDLYLENGELNIKALESYYDSFSERLTKKQRDLVSDIIESGNAVNDAAAQQAEYLTEVFSEAADTIATDMVDAFLESGDAALDLRHYVSDVAQKMAADLIKTLYLLPIMNDYAEELKTIAADSDLTAEQKTAKSLDTFRQALSEIEAQSGAINATLSELEEYFEKPDDGGTTALGDGIKGITEDQANLLASYLNAIRADVSFSKTLWVKMDANLQRIADMLVSSPSLMEYQAQIAANTYNTAMATQEMLSYIRSVVTYDSGDASIRIYS